MDGGKWAEMRPEVTHEHLGEYGKDRSTKEDIRDIATMIKTVKTVLGCGRISMVFDTSTSFTIVLELTKKLVPSEPQQQRFARGESGGLSTLLKCETLKTRISCVLNR